MAPLVFHIESFKVRHHECNAFGHLNTAVYLRYMQQAGIEASNAVGLDEPAYRSIKRQWLPRMTKIEYLHPIRHGDEVEVLTWVDSARRVQSKRMYEFRRTGEDDPFAVAYTNWVFINSEKLTPATIPLEIMDLFLPDQKMIPREKFPETPPPPDEIFKIHRSVEWGNVDPQGHLNNAAYLDYAEDCAIQFSKSHGWPMKKWIARGISFFAYQTQIEYLNPAELEIQLEIRTWSYNLRRAGVSQYYAFSNVGNEELLSRMRTIWVMIDLESGNPTRIPAEVHEILLRNLTSP